jgi:DNA-binding beta-propeller fold protein YncE
LKLKIIILVMLLIALFCFQDLGFTSAQGLPFSVGFGLLQGELLSPNGVAIDSEGNIYILDAGNYRVQVFDSSGKFKLMFGGKGKEPSEFMQPRDIAIFKDMIYVVDGYGDIPVSNKVAVFDRSGKFLFSFGERGSEDGNFLVPSGITIDDAGNVFVCDLGNKRIEEFSKDGQFKKGIGENIVSSPMKIYAKDGKLFVLNWGPTSILVLNYNGEKIQEITNEDFYDPISIALDDSNNLYVTNSGLNAGIYVFDQSGSFVKKIGNYGIGHGSFISPSGIAISNGTIIVSDQEISSVQALSLSGSLLWEIKGSVIRNEAMTFPLAFTEINGQIVVADSGNHRLAFFDKDGNLIKEITDIGGLKWENKSWKPGDSFELPYIKYPILVKSLSNGQLLVGDFGLGEVLMGEEGRLVFRTYFRFLIIDENGNYIKSFGDGNEYPDISDFEVDVASQNIFAAHVNTLFVLDFNGQITGEMDFKDYGSISGIAITKDAIFLSFFPGKVIEFTREGTFKNLISSFGNNPCKVSAPQKIVLDGSSNIYVADSGNARVQVFDVQGNLKEILGSRGTKSGEFIHPKYLFLDKNNLFVLDDYEARITQFDLQNKQVVKTFGENAIKEGKLVFPISSVSTSDGDIIALDGYLGMLHRFSQDGVPISKFGAVEDITMRFSSSGIFNFSGRLAIDPDDNIYVTVPNQGTIMKFDKYGNFVDIFNGSFFGMAYPFGIFVSKDDKIYVTDSALSKVYVFDKDFNNLILSFGGIGDEGGLLNSPWGITADEDGNIYVADSGNIKVKIFDSKGSFKKEIVIPCDFTEPAFTPVDIFYYKGYIFVLDSFGQKVILMDKNGNTLGSFGEKGGPSSDFLGFNGEDYFKKDLGKFLYPLGIFVRDDKIFVSDTSNSRIQVIPLSIFFDTTPPAISLKENISKFINKDALDISFSVSDDKTPTGNIKIYVNVNGNGFEQISSNTLHLCNLKEGPYFIYAKAQDAMLNESQIIKVEFLVDLTPPLITLNEVKESVEKNPINISGKVDDALSGVEEVKIQNNQIRCENNGYFMAPVNLSSGLNTITIEAIDKAGNKATKKLFVTYTASKTTIILQIGKSSFTVNGSPKILDSPPIIKNGRTLLPIRPIIEAMDGTVSWDATEKKVVIALGSTTIELWIGKSAAKVNGVSKSIDSSNPKVVPEIINGRTMLPIRFISENLGATVNWEQSTQTITITYQP